MQEREVHGRELIDDRPELLVARDQGLHLRPLLQADVARAGGPSRLTRSCRVGCLGRPAHRRSWRARICGPARTGSPASGWAARAAGPRGRRAAVRVGAVARQSWTLCITRPSRLSSITYWVRAFSYWQIVTALARDQDEAEASGCDSGRERVGTIGSGRGTSENRGAGAMRVSGLAKDPSSPRLLSRSRYKAPSPILRMGTRCGVPTGRWVGGVPQHVRRSAAPIRMGTRRWAFFSAGYASSSPWSARTRSSRSSTTYSSITPCLGLQVQELNTHAGGQALRSVRGLLHVTRPRP